MKGKAKGGTTEAEAQSYASELMKKEEIICVYETVSVLPFLLYIQNQIPQV